ncbi:hypothetical protein SLA2020_368320 [Shorea laevis]
MGTDPVEPDLLEESQDNGSLSTTLGDFHDSFSAKEQSIIQMEEDVAQSSAAVQQGTFPVVANTLEGSQDDGGLTGSLGDPNENSRAKDQRITQLEEEESLPDSGLKPSQEMQVYVPAELEGVEPLSLAPLAVDKDQQYPSQVSPNWVVEKVKDFYHIVGLSCDGFEEKL